MANASSARQRKPDLLVTGGGTLYLVFATSPVGEAWVEEHVPADAQRFAGGVAVEHRFIRDLILGARADGLVLR